MSQAKIQHNNPIKMAGVKVRRCRPSLCFWKCVNNPVVFLFDNDEILMPEDHVHCLANSRFCHCSRSGAQAVGSEVPMFSRLHLFCVVPVVLQCNWKPQLCQLIVLQVGGTHCLRRVLPPQFTDSEWSCQWLRFCEKIIREPISKFTGLLVESSFCGYISFPGGLWRATDNSKFPVYLGTPASPRQQGIVGLFESNLFMSLHLCRFSPISCRRGSLQPYVSVLGLCRWPC